jgi:hypothetical protein
MEEGCLSGPLDLEFTDGLDLLSFLWFSIMEVSVTRVVFV